MLFLETVIKLFGDPFNVKACPNATGYVYDCDVRFFLKTESDGLQFLDEGFAGVCVTVISVFAAGIGFSLLAFDPLPNLRSFLGIGVDDKVFVDRFRDLLLDFAAGWVIREARFYTFKDDHAAFFGDGGESVFGFVYCDIGGLGVVVPTEFLREEVSKVGFFEVSACFWNAKH